MPLPPLQNREIVKVTLDFSVVFIILIHILYLLSYGSCHRHEDRPLSFQFCKHGSICMRLAAKRQKDNACVAAGRMQLLHAVAAFGFQARCKDN